MASKPFQFKRFSVADNHCAHKVGTDGVLLGTWVRVLKTDKYLLDIGTGSGLIALVLAQRSEPDARIDAVEIETEAAKQAHANVLASPWPEKISIVNAAFQEYFPGRAYDLIVSNPPYFKSSLLPPNRRRTQARHAETLNFIDLLAGVNRLLAPSGRFGVILPHVEGQAFLADASTAGLYPQRLTRFMSRKHKPVERLLIEFTRVKHPLKEDELVLFDEGEAWSETYQLLTRDFYLKL